MKKAVGRAECCWFCDQYFTPSPVTSTPILCFILSVLDLAFFSYSQMVTLDEEEEVKAPHKQGSCSISGLLPQATSRGGC